MATTTAEYKREWRKKRKAKVDERLRGEVELRKDGKGALSEFSEYVRKEAMKAGAKSAVMGVYKELLKLRMAVGGERGMSGDEIAGMMLEAERELREGGYKGGKT